MGPTSCDEWGSGRGGGWPTCGPGWRIPCGRRTHNPGTCGRIRSWPGPARPWPRCSRPLSKRKFDRLSADDRVESLSLGEPQQLRVVEARDLHADRKHGRPADDGARERAHADLVDPRHDLVAHGARHALVTPQHRPAHRTRDYLRTGRGLKTPLTSTSARGTGPPCGNPIAARRLAANQYPGVLAPLSR